MGRGGLLSSDSMGVVNQIRPVGDLLRPDHVRSWPLIEAVCARVEGEMKRREGGRRRIQGVFLPIGVRGTWV